MAAELCPWGHAVHYTRAAFCWTMFAYLAKFVKAGQNINCTHKQLHLNWKMDIVSFTVVYRCKKKKHDSNAQQFVSTQTVFFRYWLTICLCISVGWLITHTVKLRVSNMLLNVNTLCMWSSPPSDSEHVKNNSSFSLTVSACTSDH